LSEAEELQREITRLALRSLDGTSFVLAGSGAIRGHGLVDRPTEDVDLFTSDVDLSRFSSAVDAVVLGLREAGQDVAELRRVDQFARLEVTTADGHKVDIDMGVDWRSAERARRFASLDPPVGDGLVGRCLRMGEGADLLVLQRFSCLVCNSPPGKAAEPEDLLPCKLAADPTSGVAARARRIWWVRCLAGVSGRCRTFLEYGPHAPYCNALGV